MPFDPHVMINYVQHIDTLYDVTQNNIVDRRFFNQAGSPQGEVPMDLMNLGLKIFYSGAGFDMGQAPQFYVQQPRSYIFDAFYGMFSAAFNDVIYHPDWTLYERAESMYNEYVHNYMYWFPMRDQQDMFETGIQKFCDLSPHVAIKFYCLAEIVRGLICTLRESITVDQMNLYAEFALASAIVEMHRVGYDINSL